MFNVSAHCRSGTKVLRRRFKAAERKNEKIQRLKSSSNLAVVPSMNADFELVAAGFVF